MAPAAKLGEKPLQQQRPSTVTKKLDLPGLILAPPLTRCSLNLPQRIAVILKVYMYMCIKGLYMAFHKCHLNEPSLTTVPKALTIPIFFFGYATLHVESLFSPPGIELAPSALEAWRPNNWTARQIHTPIFCFILSHIAYHLCQLQIGASVNSRRLNPGLLQL